MSLVLCIKKAGKALDPQDKSAILTRAKALRDGGMAADAAGRQAVDERLAEVQGLLDAEQGAAERPVALAPAAKAAPAAVENFGEALPPARRNMAAKLTEDLSNDDAGNVAMFNIGRKADPELDDLARIGTKIAAMGYEPGDVPNLQASRKLAALVKRLDNGEISDGYFTMAVKMLSEQMADVAKTKAANRLMKDRERGPDIVREKLIRARRQGDVDSKSVDFALWALDRNPSLAAGLGISVRAPKDGAATGDYNPASEIMRVFKGGDKDDTAVHEIMHHAERMMPESMQNAIRKEWAQAFAKATAKATPEQRAALVKMIEAALGDKKAYAEVVKAIQKGPLNYADHYQLVNPSEFWAVNAARLLQRGFDSKDSVWGKIRNYVADMIQKAKGLIGLRSDAPILQALEYLMDRENFGPERGGRFESSAMLSDRAALLGSGGGLQNISRAPASQANPGTGWTMPEGTKFDNFVYKYQDKNVDLKRAVAQITRDRQGIEDRVDAYLQEELFHERAAKRTQDFTKDELGPLMKAMTQRGITMDALDEYLHNRHAEEANKVAAERNKDDQGNSTMPDGGSGIKTADARKYLAGLDPNRRQRLEAVAARVDAIIAKSRQTLVDYGLESQTVVDGWASMFQHYVPLMREDEGNGTGTGQGFSIKGKESKSRTGSTERKVVDILANIAMQRERAIVRGEKNRVAVAMAGLVDANPAPEFWQVDVIPTERVFNDKTGLVEERQVPGFKNRDNVLVAKVMDADGSVKERAIVFNESNDRAMRMVGALKNLDAAQLEGVLGVTAKITRYFSAINTQYNPVFGFVNFIRDVQGAIINLTSTQIKGSEKEVMKGVMPALSGIYSDIRKSRKGRAATSQWATLWEEFQNEGGTTGFRDLFRTSADRAKAIQREIDPTAWMNSTLGKVFTVNGTLKVPMSQAQKMAGWLFDWLSDYNLAMENAVRLSAYKTALDKGMTKQRAASLAKNLTVNFNRKGQVGMQAGALYAFFNASMQGTARMGDVMFEGEGAGMKLSGLGRKILLGGVALGAIQAMLLEAAGFDDDEPPPFVRERSLVIPIGALAGGKEYISIPMPLGWHVIPNLGRMATEFALSGFKDPGKRATDLIALIADAFNPIGNSGLSLQTVAPTVLDPLVALTENRDWTGKPIARESFDRTTPGFALAKDTASSPAKWIAEAVNLMSGGTKYTAGIVSPTPDQIDYLWGQVTGGVGRELSKVEQTATAAFTGESLPAYKIPLVGRFVGDAEGPTSQGNRFYTNLNQIALHEAEIKGLTKDGFPDQARAYRADNPESSLIPIAKVAERRVRNLRARKRELLANDASREAIRQIEERITEAMTKLNEAVERRELAGV